MSNRMARDPIIGVRAPKGLKKKLDRAAQAAGQSSSDFIRVALAEFFERYPTTDKQIEAIIRARSEEAAA